MKKLYWRPARATRPVLVLIGLVSIAAAAAVERLQLRRQQPHYREKLAASRLTQKAFLAIKGERLRRKIPIDPELDPQQSGLIGTAMSIVTSNSGVLEAKQTSINPNFAAVVLDLLKRARVNKGDQVGVGFSGSFPAINVAVLAAIKQLGLRPLIVTSASGSQFGANIPGLVWLDMEATLRKQGLFPYRSLAASLGGIQDRALGMAPEGKQRLLQTITACGVQLFKPRDLKDSIDQRWRLLQESAGDAPIAAYINVGGGSASVGTWVGKHLFRHGLNRTAPRGMGGLDSVMARFIRDGVPVIHLINIDRLATRYGLPLQPTFQPRVGEGKTFYRDEYNLWLAAGMLVLIVVALYAFIRSDLGYRLFQTDRNAKAGPSHPEKMV
jgi:poly-gamma-glutamate system protein